MIDSKRICIIPRLTGVGGPTVFQQKLSLGLKARGFEVTFDLEDHPYHSVLVVGGTRNLTGLRRARNAGVPIIQRLNGMNWIHRRRRTGLKHYLRAEYGNIILSTIRRRLADQIVYQSDFARQWWDAEKGQLATPPRVIHNGVDLNLFTPHGPPAPPENLWRVLLVEGNLAGGYDLGLEHAVELAQKMNRVEDRPVELVVAGNVPEPTRARLNSAVGFQVQWMGHLPQDEIPTLDRSAHLLFSADVNAACPNSVIEAMACGLPVLALNSGALPELVSEDAGIVVPYGGDPWQLDSPDLEGLAEAGVDLLKDQARYRTGARKQAEKHFSLDKMVASYLEVL